MSKDEKLFDVRVSDRYIKEGLINKKEYESFIKKLPDVEEKSELLVIEEDVEPEETTEETENTEAAEDESGEE